MSFPDIAGRDQGYYDAWHRMMWWRDYLLARHPKRRCLKKMERVLRAAIKISRKLELALGNYETANDLKRISVNLGLLAIQPHNEEQLKDIIYLDHLVGSPCIVGFGDYNGKE